MEEEVRQRMDEAVVKAIQGSSSLSLSGVLAPIIEKVRGRACGRIVRVS